MAGWRHEHGAGLYHFTVPVIVDMNYDCFGEITQNSRKAKNYFTVHNGFLHISTTAGDVKIPNVCGSSGSIFGGMFGNEPPQGKSMCIHRDCIYLAGDDVFIL